MVLHWPTMASFDYQMFDLPKRHPSTNLAHDDDAFLVGHVLQAFLPMPDDGEDHGNDEDEDCARPACDDRNGERRVWVRVPQHLRVARYVT